MDAHVCKVYDDVFFLFCSGGYVAKEMEAQWKIGSAQLEELGWKPTTTCEKIHVFMVQLTLPEVLCNNNF